MKIQRFGDTLWMEPEGDISFLNAGSMKDCISGSLCTGVRNLILNMSKITFLDSAGLGMLILLIKRMEENHGRLILEFPQLGVQKLLEMTRMDEWIEIRKTPELTSGSWAELH